MPNRLGPSCFAWLLALAALPAQGNLGWRPDRLFAPRHANAIAFDPVRQRVLGFGGLSGTSTDNNGHPIGLVLGDTCDWDGERWLRLTPQTSPAARFGHAMATDTARQRVVLFGGRNEGALFQDTWEWDGGDWQQRQPQQAPSVRHDHAMTYDPVRRRTILFGGRAVSMAFGETYEWDGQDWTLFIPPLAPMASYHNSLAYDPNLQEALLLTRTATWTWNGARWLQRTPSTTPSLRGQQQMATDSLRNRVVVLGGFTDYPPRYYFETLEWDGADWTMSTGPALYAGAMAYDPVRRAMVAAGGKRYTDHAHLNGATWVYDGQQWLEQGEAAPEPRNEPGLCVDADGAGIFLFGGFGIHNHTHMRLGDTWTHDGQTWQRRHPPNAPSARHELALAHDPVRQRVVLHGGWNGFAALDDTWEWDGSSWSQALPPVSPPVRLGHRLAFDPARQRILMFGGADDQWEWDGANWSPVTLGVRPPRRTYPLLVGDPMRRRVVLFGGSSPQLLDDTWEWDGTVWHSFPVAVRPPVAMSSYGAFDPLRQRVVMPGLASQHPHETWEWDGAAWQLQATPLPAWSGGTVACFHPALQRVISFGGLDSDTHVWSYGSGPVASLEKMGTGCAGMAGVPELAASTPALTSPVLALDLHADRPAAPCAFGIALFSRPQPVGNGCTLYLDQPQLAFATTNGAGFADLRAHIPMLPSLRGIGFYVQAAVLDVQGSVASIALTAALRLTLGD